jgi:hypothetical protein
LSLRRGGWSLSCCLAPSKPRGSRCGSASAIRHLSPKSPVLSRPSHCLHQLQRPVRVGDARGVRSGPLPADRHGIPSKHRGCWQHWNYRSVPLFYVAFPLKYHTYRGCPESIRARAWEAGTGHNRDWPQTGVSHPNTSRSWRQRPFSGGSDRADAGRIQPRGPG